MDKFPASAIGLEHEKFAPPLTPPLSVEDSPEDEESSSSTVAPNKSQTLTGGEEVVQAVAEVEEEQLPLISSNIQDSNSFSTSAPDAYYEDSDEYFNYKEVLKLLLGSESDEN